tara:strand:- start:808 stop:981 length:174 start_codon:yes stop_codon:yes gene_type:complete
MCIERHDNDSMWKDWPETLSGNRDKAECSKAVSNYCEKLKPAGRLASFTDPASALEK